MEPYYDHYKLNELCQVLEEKHHLQGYHRHESEKEKAANSDLEAQTGELSLLSWLKEHIREKILDYLEFNTVSKSWQTVHELLGQHGLEIKLRGAGLVIGDPEKGLYVKASSVSRKFSLKSMTNLLGPFQPCEVLIQKDLDASSYNRQPQVSHPDSNELYALYQAQRDEKAQHRREALQQLRSESHQYTQKLKSWYDEEYKRLRYGNFLNLTEKRTAFRELGIQRRKDLANHRSRYTRSKQAIIQNTRSLSWTSFLREQAQSGSETALSVLRGRGQQESKSLNNILTAENKAEVQSLIYHSLKPKVLKNGTLIYQLKDGGLIRDTKDQI